MKKVFARFLLTGMVGGAISVYAFCLAQFCGFRVFLEALGFVSGVLLFALILCWAVCNAVD